MQFQDPAIPALVRSVEPMFAGSLNTAARSSDRSDFFDVLRREVKEFHVGLACYRLRSSLLARFYPRIKGANGQLTLTPSPLSIVGRGVSFEEAWTNWQEQFHIRFQTLLRMRPWEMQADQREEWERIEQLVDVAAYRRETPRVIRQIGWLTRRRPIPDQIRWENGRQEQVALAQMHPAFAALHEGDRFEAEVMRDAVTGELIQAVVVRRLPPLRQTAKDEALWSELPTTAAANSVGWDEFE